MKKFKHVIVGGGLVGLAIAFSMAELGEKGIAVVESRYVAYGASGRNAAHFRVHFWARENVVYAIESRKRLLDIKRFVGDVRPDDPRLSLDIGGYLWLIDKEEVLEAYRRTNEQIWKPLGYPVEFLTPEEVRERFPYINLGDEYIAAVYGPQDGKINYAFIAMKLAERLRSLGVEVIENTRVNRIVVESGKVKGIETSRGVIESETVTVAAGAYSKEILKTAGVDIPLEPVRKEIGVLEHTKYFIKPLVIDMKSGAYVGQLPRGEILGSIDVKVEPGLKPLENTYLWVSKWLKEARRIIPKIARYRLVRTWSGYYAMTPDHSHILGRDEEWPQGLYVATGFSGHGAMMSLYTGEVMAKYILSGKIEDTMKPYLPTRFKEGKLVNETMVIG